MEEVSDLRPDRRASTSNLFSSDAILSNVCVNLKPDYEEWTRDRPDNAAVKILKTDYYPNSNLLCYNTSIGYCNTRGY